VAAGRQGPSMPIGDAPVGNPYREPVASR